VATRQIGDPANTRSRRTRAALLDAARELIEAEGFAALNMAAVADRAGVTRRAVYLHFATRAELATALFDHVGVVEDLAGSLQRVWAAADADAALDEWAAHLARFHPRIRAIDLAASRVADTDPAARTHRAQVVADQQAVCRRLAEWLAREQRLTLYWTPACAADLLWALMSSDLLTRLLDDCGWSEAGYGEALAAILRKTLLREPDHEPTRTTGHPYR
jgi:AcrR family transcriptional regulator